jgi:hypothetical protein
MLYRDKIAAYIEVYTKHTNTVGGQNVRVFECESGGT